MFSRYLLRKFLSKKYSKFNVINQSSCRRHLILQEFNNLFFFVDKDLVPKSAHEREEADQGDRRPAGRHHTHASPYSTGRTSSTGIPKWPPRILTGLFPGSLPNRLTHHRHSCRHTRFSFHTNRAIRHGVGYVWSYTQSNESISWHNITTHRITFSGTIPRIHLGSIPREHGAVTFWARLDGSSNIVIEYTRERLQMHCVLMLVIYGNMFVMDKCRLRTEELIFRAFMLQYLKTSHGETSTTMKQ